MSDIVVREQYQAALIPRTFAEAREFAVMIANSDLAPKDYRGKPGNVIVAMTMGAELGLSVMQSIQNIAVINGKGCVYGDAMLAIAQAHSSFRGCHETFDAATNTATCEVRRGDREPVVRSFSEADARLAGLWGKQGPWSQYPRRMLQMRARAFALRDSFADALRGIASAEEVGDYQTEPRQTMRQMAEARVVNYALPAHSETTATESPAEEPAPEVEPPADVTAAMAEYVQALAATENEQELAIVARAIGPRLGEALRPQAAAAYKSRLAELRRLALEAP